MSDQKLTITLDLDRSGATRQAQAFRAQQKALAQGLLADEIAAEQAREALARKEGQARTQAARQAGAAMGKVTRQATDDATDSFNQIGKAGKSAFAGIGKAVGSFAVQMLGLDSAKAVIGAIVDNFELARTNAYKASQMVHDYRESLLELAALKGKLGNTTEATKEEIAFRAQTLQKAPDARGFQMAALGVGESSIDDDKPGGQKRLISRDEFTKAMVLGGRFQSTENGGADPHGTLVGLIPQFQGRRTTGEEVARKEQQLFDIFQPGGFEFSSGINQFAKLAPLITSGVYKDTEAAALLSAFSTSNKEGAGEVVQQFTRATLGSVGKMAGVRIEGAEKIGQYYKSLGITDEFLKHTKATSQPFAIADKVAADIDRAKTKAEAKGESFNPTLYLKHKGFGNQEDAAALQLYYGLRQSGAWQDKFLPLAGDDKLPTAKQARARLDQAQLDPVFLERDAKYREEVANVAVGAGPQEYVNSLKKAAFANRRARGETSYDTYEAVQALGTLNPANWLFNERGKTDIEAQKMLVAEADRRGVKHGLIGGVNPETGAAMNDFAGDSALVDLAKQVRAAGGNVLPGRDEVTAKAQAQLSASNLFGPAPPAPAEPAGGKPGGDMAETNKLLGQLVQNTAPKAQPPRPLVGPPPARTR